jgi:mono/diheme cytochrome c family protein
MRYFFLALLLLTVTVVGIAGFRGEKFSHPPIEVFPDMDHQAKVRPQGSNFFFADGLGTRKPIAGTVPMGLEIPTGLAAKGYIDPAGFTHGTGFYQTGKMENGTHWGDGYPSEINVDEAFLRRGKELYDVHCFICHGVSGNGKGMLAMIQIPDDPKHPDKLKANWGIANVANFYDARFTDPANPAYAPTGSIYDTVTNGKGLMGKYGNNLNVIERWAVVAYIKSLPLSRSAPLTDPKVKAAWDAAVAAGKAKE